MDMILFIVGFAVLLKSADFLVQGGASVAARFGVSPLVIGLTVISFGTSLPELLVTMISGLRNNADLAVANLIGSNIANVLLVLGIAAIIRPLPIHDSTVVSEIPFSLIAALLAGFLANAALFSTHPELSISRLDGGILLFFFLLFMLYIYKVTRDNPERRDRAVTAIGRWRATAYVVAGVIGLFFGGRWVVDGAVELANMLGVSDALIGLTIVAVGTSLPELVASAVAAYRNQTDIAVGNVVGSNIINLLLVLGLTASVVELPFYIINNSDIMMVIAASSMIILAMVSSRQNSIDRVHGVIFVVLYLLYLGYVINR